MHACVCLCECGLRVQLVYFAVCTSVPSIFLHTSARNQNKTKIKRKNILFLYQKFFSRVVVVIVLWSVFSKLYTIESVVHSMELEFETCFHLLYSTQFNGKLPMQSIEFISLRADGFTHTNSIASNATHAFNWSGEKA